MVCDTKLREKQSIQGRALEVREAVETLSRELAAGRVKVTIGPQGAIAFDGADAFRNGISDACLYRRLMVTGSAAARSRIAQAERMAGRTLDRRVIGQGVHSHDGGRSWRPKG